MHMPLAGAAGRALLLAACVLSAPVTVWAAAADYRFDLAGPPEPTPDGRSAITLRLVHLPDGKPVPGAVLFRLKADMGPAGMAAMTAPVELAGEPAPGLYRVLVKQNMAGAWAVTIAAKVQGEMETVRGTVTATLGR